MAETRPAKELDARRLAFYALALSGCGLTGLGFAIASVALAALAFIAAGVAFTLSGVAAWPWLSGEIESRSIQRDQGGW